MKILLLALALTACQPRVASWYGEKYRGRPTASGELFDPDRLTAAHRTLPFGTKLLVKRGSRSVVVTVNDRGPFVPGRDLDLSWAAFRKLADPDRGLIDVTYVPLSSVK